MLRGTFRIVTTRKFKPEFSTENGLANSRFHTLLFGINRLRSDTIPHFCAKRHCLGAFVQLLCNQNFNGLSCRCTPITSANDGASCGSCVRMLARPVTTSLFLGTNPADEPITPGLPIITGRFFELHP